MDRSVARLEDYYISYAAEGATREPTPEEYAEMLNRTTNYYQRFFEARYANNPTQMFVRIDSLTDYTLYQAGIPEARFNIYINFNVTRLEFTEGSVAPTTAEVFQIMREAVNGVTGQKYILEEVQTFVGSPFESTNEIYFAATQLAPDMPSP
jgi:hypothetical protein